MVKLTIRPTTCICLTVPAAALAAFYVYRKYQQRFFKKLGVPGPEPHWLFGNLGEFWETNQRHIVIPRWTKKYGKVFGYFEGSSPILVFSTTEAVEQICVKQFHSFPVRKGIPIFPEPNDFPESPFSNVTTLWGERWKRLRTITNPGFSTGKLKAYLPLIHKSQEELVKLFEEYAASSKPFEALETFQYLALDVISEVAFGIELNSIGNRGRDNPILPKMRRLLADFVKEPFVLRVIGTLPALATIVNRIIVQQMKTMSGILAPIGAVANVAASVVAQRQNNPSIRRNDLLQMMLDATKSGQTFDGQVLEPLTANEVVSQAMNFFGAGTNTTAAILAYTSFVMTTHPDYQEKLRNEIFGAFENVDTVPDYDTVMKLEFLDCFIHEVIRLYPIGFLLVNRIAVEDTEICGIPLEKRSANVMIDVFSVHRDPELWGPVDPDSFHPERFSPDYPTTATRPSSAFLGFGFGPRICLGMRLALFEIKLTLVNLLRRFKFVPMENGYSGNELPISSPLFLLPKFGITVKVQPLLG